MDRDQMTDGFMHFLFAAGGAALSTLAPRWATLLSIGSIGYGAYTYDTRFYAAGGGAMTGIGLMGMDAANGEPAADQEATNEVGFVKIDTNGPAKLLKGIGRGLFLDKYEPTAKLLKLDGFANVEVMPNDRAEQLTNRLRQMAQDNANRTMPSDTKYLQGAGADDDIFLSV